MLIFCETQSIRLFVSATVDERRSPTFMNASRSSAPKPKTTHHLAAQSWSGIASKISTMNSHDPNLLSVETLERAWECKLTPLSDEERAHLVLRKQLKANTFWIHYDNKPDEKKLAVMRICSKCSSARQACDRAIPSCSRCDSARLSCERDLSSPEELPYQEPRKSGEIFNSLWSICMILRKSNRTFEGEGKGKKVQLLWWRRSLQCVNIFLLVG